MIGGEREIFLIDTLPFQTKKQLNYWISQTALNGKIGAIG
ncbi:hypothetical protein HMPREF9512_00040 [Enterococcus faecalis EnGen0311]|nr:hypothetical protein HMPREF9512_00040 [Enterococcus faecalis EnGen0311]